MTRQDSDNRWSLSRWRFALVVVGFAALACAVVARAVDLQVFRNDFLQVQGDARYLRVVDMPAHRGMIRDRDGEPLAVSSPVDSVWADPGQLLTASDRVPRLAKLLGLKSSRLLRRLHRHSQREFVYIERHVTPELGKRVMDLKLPGVALKREYQRFYPAGEVAGHVLGFTNIDDHGQEGLELAYDDWLSGKAGAKRVIKDRLGRVVEDVEQIKAPKPGRDLTISIDRRLQYLAYRELKAAVIQHHARSGSLVLLNPRTGEVLAMVNQPAFNPNRRDDLKGTDYRNRAVTDVFEPGSTIKPFTVAAALEYGAIKPRTTIDTRPGVLRVGGHPIHDSRDFGVIDISTIIQKSSNVGAAKIALSMPSDVIWSMLGRVGFGRRSGSAFPGESSGTLPVQPPRSDIGRATIAFGYGLSTTALQLAQAYCVIATNGLYRPVTFLKSDGPVRGERVMEASTAKLVRRMMQGVVSTEGTAPAARIAGYQVAGKTGTVKKPVAGGYSDDRYKAVFAGMAPASDPQLVMAVMVDEPTRGGFYGGQVAAPVFERVMSGALRLLNIPPDNVPRRKTLVAARGGGE